MGEGESNPRHFQCSSIDLKKEHYLLPIVSSPLLIRILHTSPASSLYIPFVVYNPAILHFLKKAISLASGPLHLLFFLPFYPISPTISSPSSHPSLIQSRTLAYHHFHQDAFPDTSVCIYRPLTSPCVWLSYYIKIPSLFCTSWHEPQEYRDPLIYTLSLELMQSLTSGKSSVNMC